MGEFLDLIVTGKTDIEISRLLREELPGLAERLDVEEGRVTTKLATADRVYLTLPEMASLYWFIRDHDNVALGPGHEYNATPDEILRTHASLYLGPWDDHDRHGRRVLVPQEICDLVDHRQVWRKTKKTMSRNGRWYHRKIRPDEAHDGLGHPHGYQEECPNNTNTFTAYEAGVTWDWETNQGRTLYQCRPCGRLFTMGTYATPQYEALAEALAADQRGKDHER